MQWLSASLAAIALACIAHGAVHAQSDYRNTDAGRPIRIEDATPTERYAFELEIPTLRVERLADGSATLRVEPLLSFGVLPRTELDVRLPYVERGPNLSPRGGFAGVGITVLHNFNLEKDGIPAFALSGSALLPVGAIITGPTTLAVKAIATRSFRFARLHANVLYGTYYVPPAIVVTPPDCPLGSIAPGCGGTGGGPSVPRFPDGPCSFAADEIIVAQARCMAAAAVEPTGQSTGVHWLAGMSADHAFALRSMLLLADLYAEQFTGLGRPPDWTAELGMRNQITPRTVIDFSLGRRFTGLNTAWLATLATTVTFGVRPLVPLHAMTHRPSLVRYYHQTYLPAHDNWDFRSAYPAADHLFNAFDYGHAILYERLLTSGGATKRLDTRDFDFVVHHVLRHPSSVPLDESAIAPAFAKLVPEAVEIFEWAHMLHRQVYDAFTDERLRPEERDAHIAQTIRYYRSRGDLAFSTDAIGMQLMVGQTYSGTFKAANPKFNGLIWSYHWLQMKLYESLMQNPARVAREQAVANDLKTFFAMLDDAPARMPAQMPMTNDVAPSFAQRYPEATNIFDNLHSFHDVVSDILTDPRVPRSRKRTEILRAAELFRNGAVKRTAAP